jgi:hypothetical protein
VRSDAESGVIFAWVLIGLLLLAGVLYDAWGSGAWPRHLLVLAVGEGVLAAACLLVLSALRGRRR